MLRTSRRSLALCHTTMITNHITEFESFVANDVDAAAKELSGIKTDAQRKHLQRLVYTNLVDRFDSMVDHTLLVNAASTSLLDEALSKLNDPLPEGELLRLLLASNASVHAESRVQEYVRTNILRKRHSQKLEKLLGVLHPSVNATKAPRVNVNTGAVVAKFTPQNNKIPASICGYADWLYSRRNSVVHGAGGTALLRNDLDKLKSLYNAQPAAGVKISVGSISSASKYYLGVSSLLKSPAVT